MAHAYAFGEGVPQDRRLASHYYSQREPNEKKLSKTYLWIAREMEKGSDNNRKNPQEALAWYFFSALKGNKQAQYQLAQAYRNGYYQLLNTSETCSQFWFALYENGTQKRKETEIPKDCNPIKGSE